ncbi:hypothetical protein VSR01_00330 [Actinacidiphila sp. DG2A-62]|uniref:hypothetical protein n=1 Tax=Actinacidiphila sp. DG2A-62 TaxID=3108821 RepID=UPI002DB662EA|nr:hypothetical protein [Actinacidiphila sp. DG2A-62]MEC3992075.1 hypothetical protein [Actinacidiphila sp. DG2A-62]
MPQDQESAAVLYEQLAFGDVADDVQEHQENDQEDSHGQEFVISPERRVWLEGPPAAGRGAHTYAQGEGPQRP